eukprot:9449574-Alexandrium_andersonii.AAC.1
MATLSARRLTSLGYKSAASGILVVLPSTFARPPHPSRSRSPLGSPLVAWGGDGEKPTQSILDYRTWKASGRMRMKRERIE